MDPITQKKMVMTTDFPLDKVIFLHLGMLDLSSSLDYIFPNPFTFTPLIKVVWSTSPDFNTTYGVGDGPLSTNPSFPFLPNLAVAKADLSSITLQFGNPGSIPSAYIRMYAFMPSDTSSAVEPNTSAGDAFVINSEYNYSKLYRAGVTPFSSTAGSTETINHDLDYYPQIEAWYEKSGAIYSMAQIFKSGGSLSTESFELTNSNLILRRDPFLTGSERFHYRIYLDDIQ